MEQKLTAEELEKLVTLQKRISELVSAIGEIQLRIRDLNKEIKRLSELAITVEEEFDVKNGELGDALKQLRETYPDGEIDLNTGIITTVTQN